MGAKWMIHANFGAYRTNRFKVIQILVNFSFSLAAILDLENNRFELWHCLYGIKAKPHTKFGENQSSGSEVIEVFVNF